MEKPTKEEKEERIVVNIDGNIKEAMDEFFEETLWFQEKTL